MAETVIGRPFLRITQAVIGFVDFLEPLLGGRILGIAIRMETHRLLAERRFEFLLVRALGDAQRFVEICLHHVPQKNPCPRRRIPVPRLPADLQATDLVKSARVCHRAASRPGIFLCQGA